MTIHDEHPFADPEPIRSGGSGAGRRDGEPVVLRCGAARAGLTVTSFLVAAGEPARLLALLDPDAALTETLLATGSGVVQLLAWEHRGLAEMFAGTAPAPGGMFSHAEFEQTAWGPRLAAAASWAGVRLETEQQVGWSTLVTTVVERLEIGDDGDPLRHHRGRFAR